jgi:hypothetical protein
MRFAQGTSEPVDANLSLLVQIFEGANVREGCWCR